MFKSNETELWVWLHPRDFGLEALPALLSPGRLRKILRVRQRQASASSCSHQWHAFQGFPLHSSPFPLSGISQDATVNWLLFILHPFTFQVSRKYILKKAAAAQAPTKVEFHLGREVFSQWLLLTWLLLKQATWFFCLRGRRDVGSATSLFREKIGRSSGQTPSQDHPCNMGVFFFPHRGLKKVDIKKIWSPR